MNSLPTPINSVNLPFHPGNSFEDPLKSRFPRSQSFDFKNGYAIPRISLEPRSASFLQTADHQLTALDPTLIYGQLRRNVQNEVPNLCPLDKKLLKFYGYFKQTVNDSPDETYRVRTIILYYYLVDDTILIMEPCKENSGIWQGKILRRQRVPKNSEGDHFTWKDLNIGTDIYIYGKMIRLVDCDRFTAEYLKSEGIELNSVDAIPPDPYMEKRHATQPVSLVITPSNEDKLYHFQKYDKKVLRFHCLWDDRNSLFGEIRPFILLYYLADNTMEIREIHVPNDGHDPFPVLLHKQKVPKDRLKLKNDIALGILEPKEEDLDWYSPIDFRIGKTISIMGRDLLLYDCDKFTRNFYETNFGITDFTPVKISIPEKQPPPKLIPPYLGWGSREDSIQSCLQVQPKPAKKDMIRALEKLNTVLRFEAVMDSVYEVHKERKFVISIYPSDNTVAIFEPPIQNSGFLSGLFLTRVRVPKPNTDDNNPEYYKPKDFYKGARVEIFKHIFLINEEDQYIKKYREMYPEEFSDASAFLSANDKGPEKLRFELPEDANTSCPVIKPRDEPCPAIDE